MTDKEEKYLKELALNTALLAGKLLMRNGSETTRVEDTMNRIIQKSLEGSSETEFDTYVLLNSVFVRIGKSKTGFYQVNKRRNNLGVVADVNQLSRDYAEEKISLESLQKTLKEMDTLTPVGVNLKYLLATVFISGSAVFLFAPGATAIDIFPAVVAGITAYTVYYLTSKYLDVPFMEEFLATLFGGFLGYIACRITGTSFSVMTIGAVIPLVPGIAITNAARDIMARHYLTGIIRFVESLCVAAALGGGIALVSFIVGG